MRRKFMGGEREAGDVRYISAFTSWGKGIALDIVDRKILAL